MRLMLRGENLQAAIRQEHEDLMEFLSNAEYGGLGPEVKKLAQTHLDELDNAAKEIRRSLRYYIEITSEESPA